MVVPSAAKPPATNTSPSANKVRVAPARPVAGAPVPAGVVKVSAVPGGTDPESVTVTVAVLDWSTITVLGFRTRGLVVLVRLFTVSELADEALGS